MEFHRGDLFRNTPHEHEADPLQSLRRPPVVLDATLKDVIQTLQKAEKSDPALPDA
jgi:hypothetical protein